MNQSEVSALPKRKSLIDTNVNSQNSYSQADGIRKNIVIIFMDPPLSVWTYFNPPGHDWRMTFYIVVHKMGFCNFPACSPKFPLYYIALSLRYIYPADYSSYFSN